MGQVDGCDRGFTLIETLVAMMIMAICLVVILQLFSGGLKAGRLSDDYTRAVFYARAKMEELLLAKKLTDGVLEGEFGGGYKWKALIMKVEPQNEDQNEDRDGDKDEDLKMPIDTYGIKVDVTWFEGNREKNFEISTLKILEKTEDETT